MALLIWYVCLYGRQCGNTMGSSCFSYTILGFWAKLNWTTYIGTRYSFVKVSFFSEQTLMEEDEIKDINTIMPFSLFFYFISLPLPHDLWTDDSHGNCNVLEKSNRRSQKDAHFVVFLSCDILRWWFVNDIQTEHYRLLKEATLDLCRKSLNWKFFLVKLNNIAIINWF